MFLLAIAAVGLNALPRPLPCATARPPCRRATIVAEQVANEFARPVSVAAVDRKAKRLELEATPEECAALADRFELESLGSLVANVSLALVDKRRSRVRAYGKLTAGNVERIGISGQMTTIQVRQLLRLAPLVFASLQRAVIRLSRARSPALRPAPVVLLPQVEEIPFETFFMPEEELDTGGSVDTEDEYKYDEVGAPFLRGCTHISHSQSGPTGRFAKLR